MLKKLFTSKFIGSCKIENRLVVTAMVTNYCGKDGKANEQYIRYHEEKAKGGWGLIITEDYAINKHAMGYENIAGLYDDSQIESHKKLTDRIHQYDSKIFAQIYHAGRQSSHGVNGNVDPVAPSAIPCPWCRELPKELTIPEIEEIVTQFGDCALRAKAAGFDGVEVHAGHGYLLAEFLSPAMNKRTDYYGGPFENRVRIIDELMKDIRQKVGDDYPVIIRFSADENMEGGRRIAESRMLAKAFEEMGFDALNVSNGSYGDHNKGIVAPMYTENAFNVDNSQELKKYVDIPVIVANRINDPRMAETILEDDKADFIGMGRGSLADPHLPNKTRKGDFPHIRYCINCLQGCTGALYFGGQVTCMVNPAVGQEYRIDYSKNQKEKIWVIGGGVGGIQAALEYAKKGNDVSLFEKSDRLGGQFISAAYPPCKGGFTTLLPWMTRELEEHGVTVHLNQEISITEIKQEKPDLVVLATGGQPSRPSIPGIDGENVVTAEDALVGKVAVGDRVVITGGGEVGEETAAHIAMSGKMVNVVEMQPDILNDLDGVNKYNLKKILDEYDVVQHTNSKVVKIEENGVWIEKNEETQVFLDADTVILAFGYTPFNPLEDSLKELGLAYKVIGGARETSNAITAIQEGFQLVHQ